MAYSVQAVRAANSIDRWKRRAQTEHRKPPPGLKLLPRHKLIALLLERDGPNCMCGCGKPIDPDHCEIEHKISLESVKDLPDAERAKYFEPANLRLFRPRCQLKKSAQETTQRAHLERAAEKERLHQERMASKRLNDGEED